MPNYNEASLSGSEYTRCYEIRIANQLDQIPIIEFKEQRITTLSNGKTITDNIGLLEVSFNPAMLIELIDPTTGQQTGQTITFADVYAILYSAYIKQATIRDSANVA